MATAKIIEQEVVINLELSKAEAIWLKGMVQNSLSPNESQNAKSIRSSIWDALDNAKIRLV